MPGPAQPNVEWYEVAAAATTHVSANQSPPNGSFTPGALPNPTIDNVGIPNGSYFLLTDQNDPNQNGVWLADANGPVPIMTFGLGNVNPEANIQVAAGNPGSQNGGSLWTYTAQFRGTGTQPGFTKIR